MLVQICKTFNLLLKEMFLRGHFGCLFSIKELASVELMDGDKLVSVLPQNGD